METEILFDGESLMTDSAGMGHNAGPTFPSVKEDIVAVKKSLQEVCDSMTRVAAERDLIKDIKKQLKDKYGMKPKMITRLAKTMFNDDFDIGQVENEDFVDAYNKLKKA